MLDLNNMPMLPSMPEASTIPPHPTPNCTPTHSFRDYVRQWVNISALLYDDGPDFSVKQITCICHDYRIDTWEAHPLLTNLFPSARVDEVYIPRETATETLLPWRYSVYRDANPTAPPTGIIFLKNETSDTFRDLMIGEPHTELKQRWLVCK